MAAIAAAGAIFAGSTLLGRNLAGFELGLILASSGLLGWGFTASRRRRERKRVQGMRDSALW